MTPQQNTRADESVGILLERRADDWTVRVASFSTPTQAGASLTVRAIAPELAPFLEDVPGDGPGDALERLGQTLDERETRRLVEQRRAAGDDPRGEADR